MMRDLGIWSAHQVSYSYNAFELYKQAQKALGYILRQTQFFKTHNSPCVLYNAYVCSRLESNSMVWNPHLDAI